MLRLAAVLLSTFAATTSSDAGSLDLLGDAVELFEKKCPLIESDFEAADQEFRTGTWRPTGNWSKTPLGRYGGWGNDEDTMVVSFQNLRFSDARFWQCRVSVLISDLEVDPKEFVRRESMVDGYVETKPDGGFTGIWKVEGDLFTSVNASYDGKLLHLVRMAISEEDADE